MLRPVRLGRRTDDEGRSVVKRLVAGATAFVLVGALCAEPAIARGPAGRTFHGAVFSAGVSGDPSAAPGPPIMSAPSLGGLVRVSTDAGVSAPLTAEELTTSGSVALDSQAEPMVSVNQSNRANVVGFWQEDRWTSGGSRNLVFGTSFDGGQTWANSALHGVGILAGGEFQRLTDPWVDFGPSNRVYAFSLGFDDTGPDNGLFVSTSTDGGLTWGSPVAVIVDRRFEFFNDKNALAADDWSSSPHRGNVYLAWDRLIEDPLGQPFVGTFTGPAMFARSTDGGASFSTPEVLFETGTNKQTIGNVPVRVPERPCRGARHLLRQRQPWQEQPASVGHAVDRRRPDVQRTPTGHGHAVAARSRLADRRYGSRRSRSPRTGRSTRPGRTSASPRASARTSWSRHRKTKAGRGRRP
jgi:hypothetical protein